jgi:hypothetical protein
VKGALPLYISEEIKDVLVEYHNVYPDMLLGQTALTRFRTPFHVEKPENILKSLLEIGVIVPRLSMYNMILVFNNVTLTRELKPGVCVDIDNKYYCKLVFDVTPVITSKPSQTLRLDAEYRGVEEINIAHVGFITLKKSGEASSSILFYSGSLLLDPGEAYILKLQQKMESALARFVLFVPHPSAVVKISSNDDSVKPLEISGASGFSEYTMSVGNVSEIRIEYKGDKSYYPRTLILSSVLVYKSSMPLPSIDIAIREIKGDKALVKVVNSGTGEARNLILTSISRGNVLDRQLIERLEPGQEEELEVRMDPSFSSIRVIWRQLDKTEFKEVRIRNGVIAGKED